MPVAPLSPFLLDLLTEGWDPPWSAPPDEDGERTTPTRPVGEATPHPSLPPRLLVPGSAR